MTEVRIEHDLLGDREVPMPAYYGVHTLRAKENFQISGTTISAFPKLVCLRPAHQNRLRHRAAPKAPV